LYPYSIGEAGLYDAVVKTARARILVVDAPLHRPYKGFRPAERDVMRSLGARLLPGGTPGMQKLAQLGLSIRSLAEEAGITVLESHPSTQRRLGDLSLRSPGPHARDAVTLLLVAAAYLAGCYVEYNDGYSRLVFAREECLGRIVLGSTW